MRTKKNAWYMKMKVTPIVIGALGTIFKGLAKGLGDLKIKGQVETPRLQHYLYQPDN